MRKHITIFVTSFVLLSLLSACSNHSESNPGTIGNSPSSSASVSAPDSKPSSSTSIDQKTVNEIAKVVKILRDAKSTATPIMSTTNERITNEVLKPYFGGELSGMKVITWLALGADVDESSVKVKNDSFSVNLVADNKTVATIEGVLVGDTLRPTSFSATIDGSEWYNSVSEVMNTWATS